jgi:hypothetical protein
MTYRSLPSILPKGLFPCSIAVHPDISAPFDWQNSISHSTNTLPSRNVDRARCSAPGRPICQTHRQAISSLLWRHKADSSGHSSLPTTPTFGTLPTHFVSSHQWILPTFPLHIQILTNIQPRDCVGQPCGNQTLCCYRLR